MTDSEKKASGLKKAGIVIDDYKVNKCESLLRKEGFTDFTKMPFTKGVTSIFVWVTADKVNKIQTIVGLVETHFKRSN